MRKASVLFGEAIRHSHQVMFYADFYYNGRLAESMVPIEGGDWTEDGTADVPESGSITIPETFISRDDRIEVNMHPYSDTAAVGINGQQVEISCSVMLPNGDWETISLGRFLIQSWQVEKKGLIEIEFVGLLAMLVEDDYVYTLQIPSGWTYERAVITIVDGLYPVSSKLGLTRYITSRMFEDERIKSLQNVLESWPARCYIDRSGTLIIEAPYDDQNDPIVHELRDGEGGTMIAFPEGADRDGIYNFVRASGEDAEENAAPVTGIDYVKSGPRMWGLPFGKKPYRMSSPLLTTQRAATEAARTRLQNLLRTPRTVHIQAVPDYRLQVGDVIKINDKNVVRIDKVSFPLSYSGSMTIDGHDLNEVI